MGRSTRSFVPQFPDDRNALFQVTHLTRTVNGKTLLDNASICVHAGDRISLTGPSGSGKTVLLRALAMLDPIDQGSVKWDGADVADVEVPKFRSRVMYLHQQPATREGTVEAVLREPFELQVHQDKTFSREQIVRWLERIGKPESFLSQSHLDVSGGESQIVAMLRAMQLNPRVLLLDEPTSALDSETSLKAESWLIDWVQATDDRAFIWITHDSQQAERISDRTVRIANGKLETA